MLAVTPARTHDQHENSRTHKIIAETTGHDTRRTECVGNAAVGRDDRANSRSGTDRDPYPRGVTAGPRDYLSGTRHALFTLSQGSCYHPDCERQVITWIDASPAVDAHIAHIHGANPGSPRYDLGMTDEQRRSFPNLILLCKPHHDLIDRIRADEYPAEILKRWKAERETGDTAALRSLTEDRLEDLIVEAVREAGPRRQVTVELAGGFLINGFEGAAVPIDGWRTILQLNPHLVGHDKLLFATVRNVGALRASVESVGIHLSLHLDETEAPLTMIGRNDFPLLNPHLPHAIESGERLNWLTSLATVEMMQAGVQGVNPAVRPAEIWCEVRLGSGEHIASERFAVELLPPT